jgi:hypothetical protein
LKDYYNETLRAFSGVNTATAAARGTMFTMKSPYARARARVGESAVQALKREAHFVEVFAHSSS